MAAPTRQLKYKKYNGKRVPYRLSKAIIYRDNKTCQNCGKVADETQDNGISIKVFEYQRFLGDDYSFPFEIDHTKPKCIGGETHYGNLRLFCRQCNRSKSGKYDEMV